MPDLSKELLQPCHICKKRWQRRDVAQYHYVDGILACRSHKGVNEWFEKVMAQSQKDLEDSLDLSVTP